MKDEIERDGAAELVETIARALLLSDHPEYAWKYDAVTVAAATADYTDAARAAIAAIESQGLKIVPVVATGEAVEAAALKLREIDRASPNARFLNWPPEGHGTWGAFTERTRNVARVMYAAMINSAPKVE